MMVDLIERPSSGSRPGYQGIAILAYALVALTSIGAIQIGAAVVASAVLVASRAFGSWGADAAAKTRNATLLVTAFFILLGFAAWRSGPQVATTTALIALPALAVGMLAWRDNGERRAVRYIASGLLVVIVVIVGTLWIEGGDPADIDVIDLHRSATQAVLDGENPYTEATAANSSRFAADGQQWVGYPYPPLTLAAYGGAEGFFGDPRWANVIAMAIAVILIVRPWMSQTRAAAGALTALALAAVAQPALGHIFKQGWTEPLALPLLVGVGLLWRRNPLLSAVLLGLAFGTKQYFILALSLLIVWGDDYRWKRLGIAGSVAALSIAPAFLIDTRAAWDALVVAHLETPLRLDSIGAAGIGWDTPLWLVLLATVGVALWMGWAGGSASRFMLGLAATLAIAFLLGSQAFLNYWFLIGAVAVVGVASDDRLVMPVSPDAGDTVRSSTDTVRWEAPSR